MTLGNILRGHGVGPAPQRTQGVRAYPRPPHRENTVSLRQGLEDQAVIRFGPNQFERQGAKPKGMLDLFRSRRLDLGRDTNTNSSDRPIRIEVLHLFASGTVVQRRKDAFSHRQGNDRSRGRKRRMGWIA